VARPPARVADSLALVEAAEEREKKSLERVSKSARWFVAWMSAQGRRVDAAPPQRRATMTKVTMMGSFTCQDGKAEEMEAVLAEMVDAASSEPGVEIYSYHRGEENTYWFFALMTDEKSMRSHGQSDAMQAAMSAFGPLVAGPPQMTVTTPVAALGLDL
jgi:quinol monooxygenase YgiN